MTTGYTDKGTTPRVTGASVAGGSGTTQVLSPLPLGGACCTWWSPTRPESVPRLAPGAAELCCLGTYQHSCGSKSEAGAATHLSPHPPSQSQGPGGSPTPPRVTCLLSSYPLVRKDKALWSLWRVPTTPPLRHTYNRGTHTDTLMLQSMGTKESDTTGVIELMACSLLK